jgi:hypothetical protein
VAVTMVHSDNDKPAMTVLVHCVGMQWTVVASGRDGAHLQPCGPVIPAAVRQTLGVC